MKQADSKLDGAVWCSWSHIASAVRSVRIISEFGTVHRIDLLSGTNTETRTDKYTWLDSICICGDGNSGVFFQLRHRGECSMELLPVSEEVFFSLEADGKGLPPSRSLLVIFDVSCKKMTSFKIGSERFFDRIDLCLWRPLKWSSGALPARERCRCAWTYCDVRLSSIVTSKTPKALLWVSLRCLFAFAAGLPCRPDWYH